MLYMVFSILFLIVSTFVSTFFSRSAREKSESLGTAVFIKTNFMAYFSLVSIGFCVLLLNGAVINAIQNETVVQSFSPFVIVLSILFLLDIALFKRNMEEFENDYPKDTVFGRDYDYAIYSSKKQEVVFSENKEQSTGISNIVVVGKKDDGSDLVYAFYKGHGEKKYMFWVDGMPAKEHLNSSQVQEVLKTTIEAMEEAKAYFFRKDTKRLKKAEEIDKVRASSGIMKERFPDSKTLVSTQGFVTFVFDELFVPKRLYVTANFDGETQTTLIKTYKFN